jgi:hypothetical protein
MSRRQSRSGISRQLRPSAAPREDRLAASPPAPGASRSESNQPETPTRFWALGLLAAVLLAVGAWVLFQVLPSQPAEPSQAVTDEEVLCDRFAHLHNAGDPAAEALLGRVPVVPDAPATSEEASRLQADFFLRAPIEILQVAPERGRPVSPTGRFVFVTKGNVAAPTLQERTSTGVERSQRTMSNPDLVVEVRDGKIYGVRAELHVGP